MLQGFQPYTPVHRSYQPYTPVNNVFLKQKWDKDVFQIHRRKVHAAKAVIDNFSPKVHQHLIVKLKKLQTESYRNGIIERDNKMLTDKMDHIMRTGGRTEHRNNYEKYSKSLNGAKHRRELVRVATENRNILRRIQARQPNYPFRQHMDDWRESRFYLLNIAKYGPPHHALWPTPITPVVDTNNSCSNSGGGERYHGDSGYNSRRHLATISLTAMSYSLPITNYSLLISDIA